MGPRALVCCAFIIWYSIALKGESIVKIKIENMVATTSLGKELDIQKMLTALEGARYDTTRFPGLVYRMKSPKVAILLFRSGKVVCTGGKNIEDVHTAFDILVKQITAAGIPIGRNPLITVQNIVASTDLGGVINLNAVAISLSLEKVEYEPEQFPGLVYRLEKPKVVMLIFGSGKMVCTGAKKTEDVELAVERVTKELRDAGLLQ
jgi:transcription initiation factor TFIID TATA-box-binding protein